MCPQQTQTPGQGAKGPDFLGREAGDDDVLYSPRQFIGQQRPITGAGQRTGAVNDFLQDHIEIEALADQATCLAKPREPRLERFNLMQ